jgi:hypothetical protein
MRQPCNFLVAAALLTTAAGPAHAQNLVQNSSFDTAAMLTNWSTYASSAPDSIGTGTGVWDGTQDVSMNPASGSAHIDFAGTPNGGNAAYGISQCVDLSAGMYQPVTTATFGTRFEVRTGQTATGGVNVTVEGAFFDAVGCGGNLITAGSQGKNILMAELIDGTWAASEILSPSFPITPLASPQSAQLRLVARRVGQNADTLSVFFDSAYLAVNGALPVTLQSFEAE